MFNMNSYIYSNMELCMKENIVSLFQTLDHARFGGQIDKKMGKMFALC